MPPPLVIIAVTVAAVAAVGGVAYAIAARAGSDRAERGRAATIVCFRCREEVDVPADVWHNDASDLHAWWARTHRCDVEPCTGIAAQWCPRCGDCRCGPSEQFVGEWSLDDPRCPLHAPDTLHATDLLT